MFLLLASHHVLEFLDVLRPGIDADQHERLVLQSLNERPLVWPGGPSDQSEFAPEVEQHDLATIVAELELLSVLILPLYVRCHFAETLSLINLLGQRYLSQTVAVDANCLGDTIQ